MIKQYANKGFTLVELVIVMAIMAVLIGVLAPTYLKYVDRTEHTTDCSNIGAIMDACEVMAADPDVTWTEGSPYSIVITVKTDGTTYSGSGPTDSLENYAKSSDIKLDSNWGPFVITATKETNGHIAFELSDDEQIEQLKKYSEALANRLE